MELSPIQPELIDECPRCRCTEVISKDLARPEALCDDCNAELDKREYDKKHGY